MAVARTASLPLTSLIRFGSIRMALCREDFFRMACWWLIAIDIGSAFVKSPIINFYDFAQDGQLMFLSEQL